MEQKLTALVVKAIAGDKEAFEELYAAHARSILFHVRSQLTNKQDYIDVAQDVAFEMFKHISSLREPAAFRSWMHQIVRNVCADHNRKLYRNEKHANVPDSEEALESVEDEGRESDPEALAVAKAEGNQLFAIVNSLSESYREIIIQRFYDDLSYKEIAEAQGISVTNVSTRLKRAMTAIREKVNAEAFASSRSKEEDKATGVVLEETFTNTVLQSEEEVQALRDDIGLKASLLSGIALVIPDATVDAVVASVGQKLASLTGAGASSVSATGSSSASPVATVGLTVLKVFSGAALVFAVAVGTTSLVSLNQPSLPQSTESEAEQHIQPQPQQPQAVVAKVEADVVFTDARGGNSDLNVEAISLVGEGFDSLQLTWQLLQAAPNENVGEEAQQGSNVVSQGEGEEISTSVLNELAPGNYQVVFSFIDEQGVKTEFMRSFHISSKPVSSALLDQ